MNANSDVNIDCPVVDRNDVGSYSARDLVRTTAGISDTEALSAWAALEVKGS